MKNIEKVANLLYTKVTAGSARQFPEIEFQSSFPHSISEQETKLLSHASLWIFCGTAGKQNTEIFAAYKKMLSKLTALRGTILANFYDSTRCLLSSFVSQSKNGEKLFMAINISEIYDYNFKREPESRAPGSHLRFKNVIKINFIWWEFSIVLHIIFFRKREHGESVFTFVILKVAKANRRETQKIPLHTRQRSVTSIFFH
jgi:hypothetical protein